MTGTSTENLWYIARDGQQHGPISDTEMRLFVENGHLRPADLLWRPGFADWRPASAVFPTPAGAVASSDDTATDAASTAPEDTTKSATPASSRHDAADQVRAQEQARDNAGGARTAGAASNAAGWTTPAATPTSAAAVSRPTQGSSFAAPTQTRVQTTPSGASPGTAGYPVAVAGGETASAAQRPIARATTTAPSSGSLATTAREPASARASDASAGGRGRKLALAAVLMAMIAGSIAYVFAHKDNILALVGVGGAPGNDVPVIKAEPTDKVAPAAPQQETAALQAPAQPAATEPTAPMPSAPADQAANTEANITPTATPPAQDSLPTIDAYYQRSKLWQYMKRAYPDWYSERISEAAALGNGGVPPRDATRSLVEGLVTLRRQHANDALQADTGMLKSIASAFLNNLQSLAEKGPDTCYGFISQGETSPKSVDLFHEPLSSPALETQALTIFEAIAAGKAAPAQHERPQKGDYDILAAELGKLGWSQADLQLFADPKALSSASPARVCAMVRDWFKAHIAITDTAVQERLLYETLRPVVAG